MAKIGAFFKKIGKAIADFAKKAWVTVKELDWNAPVRPAIAWSVFGGALAIAVVLMLIFWL